METSNRKRKMLITLALVAVVGGIAVFGTFAAFTATTSNTGNTISTGTVTIDQHTGATTLYALSNQGPGNPYARCVRVTYGGNLAASVKLYTSAGITNGSKFNLKLERGSGLTGPAADMNCDGFTPSSAPYDGQLGSFPTTYDTGIDGKASGAAWTTGAAVVDYRFTISVNDDSTANANSTSASSGSHTFTWEARSN